MFRRYRERFLAPVGFDCLFGDLRFEGESFLLVREMFVFWRLKVFNSDFLGDFLCLGSGELGICSNALCCGDEKNFG